MEKIMSKTNSTERTRELTEAELNAVSGGTGAVNPGKSGFTDIGGLSVEVGYKTSQAEGLGN
jgi:bacteriocin-like protein